MRPNTRASNVTRAVALLLMGTMAGPTPGALAGPMTTTSTVEQAADPWETLLPNLPVGTRLLLKLTTGAEIQGRLVEVRADAVVLDENQIRAGTMTAKGSLRDPQAFNRQEVLRVSVMSVPTRTAADPSADSWDLVLPAAQVGARLLVTLAAGAVLECRLVDVRPDAVVVNDIRIIEGQFTAKAATREASLFARVDVTRVAMVNPPRKFASNGQPNAAVVRFLVSSWGVGKKVDLQTITAERIRARIASIEPGGFTVVNTITARRIDFAGVHQLRPDSGRGKHIWITVGVAAGVLILLNSMAEACSTFAFSC